MSKENTAKNLLFLVFLIFISSEPGSVFTTELNKIHSKIGCLSFENNFNIALNLNISLRGITSHLKGKIKSKGRMELL